MAPAMTADGNGKLGGELGIKAGLVVLILVTFVLMARAGIGLSLANRSPEAALRADPSSDAAGARDALLRVQKDTSKRGRAAIRETSAAIVQRDPTNVVALTALGLATDDVKRARAIMAKSDELSRRQLLGQLWLIQDAVDRNDVRGALVHYDTALRTSPRAAAILFPVLVNATTDPELLPDLARMLARQPAWGAQFLQQLAQSSTDLPNASRLFQALIARGVSPGGQALVTLTQRLVDAQRYEAAWNLYRSFRKDQPRDGVRNGDFGDDPYFPVAFDWQVSENQADLAASIDRMGSNGRLSFSASSGTGGGAARQLLLLDPGQHSLSAVAYDIRSAAAQRPYINVTCAVTGAELGRLVLPLAEQGGKRAIGKISVPNGCSAQWLWVTVPAADSFEPNTGAVSQIRVD